MTGRHWLWALALMQGLDLPGTPPAPMPSCLTVRTGAAAGTKGDAMPCADAAGVAALAAQHRGARNPSVPDEHSPAPALGLFNQAATKEQFGNTFGKSVIPQAVPAPNYPAPIMPK